MEDARVHPSKLMDSGAQGNLSVIEGVIALPELVDREAEMLGEHPLTIEVPSGMKVGTVVPPSTLMETRPKPEPLPRLKKEGAAEATPTSRGPLLVFRRLSLNPQCYPQGGPPRAPYSDYISREEIKRQP